MTSPSPPSDDGEAAPKARLSRREVITGALALAARDGGYVGEALLGSPS